MQYRLRALAAAVSASLIAVPVLAQTTPDPQSVARGLALVTRNCSMCHAVGPVGDSPNPEAPHFRDLHQRYAVETLGEALAEGILVGHPQMPEFRFSGPEVADIIAYLKSIQTHQHARLVRRAPQG
jgi:mono/diheme cytochrome c family protein